MTEFVPCAPVFVVSAQRKRQVIPYRTKRWAGSILQFCWKITKITTVQYYQCISCLKLSRLARAGGESCSVSLIKVENGVIQTDPDFP